MLKSSLYPGAKDESIKMILNYCRAAGLDPMQKPVHIVPMSVSTGEKDSSGYDIKIMRDVVMPGIGLYRTQAARTGACAGISEPEFGPDHEEVLGEAKITYPLWCKVSVTRMLPDGQKAVFTATERWKENYATKSAKSVEPNAMWRKRPYAQLAKCAEAQALRKAFPEFGSQPTADEMEGKEVDVTPPAAAAPALPAGPPAYPQADFDKNLPQWRKYIEAGRKTPEDIITMVSTKGALSEAQMATLRAIKPPIEGEAKKEAAPAVDAAKLRDRLEKAADLDVLTADADLIAQVADVGTREELTEVYRVRREALEGGAQ